MRSNKYNILPAPEILKNVVECFRTIEYTGEGGLAIKVCLNGLPGVVFQHNQGQSPIENITTASRCTSSVPTLYIYGQTTEPRVMNHKKGPYIFLSFSDSFSQQSSLAAARHCCL